MSLGHFIKLFADLIACHAIKLSRAGLSNFRGCAELYFYPLVKWGAALTKQELPVIGKFSSSRGTKN
jgi:hypothetical protein